MNLKKLILGVFLIELTLSTLMIPSVYSNITEQEIALNREFFPDDTWGNIGRTITDVNPFTAYICGDNIMILNNTSNYNLVITIIMTETGCVVYDEQKETANIVIPISSLNTGEYKLTITVPEFGYVYGFFSK